MKKIVLVLLLFFVSLNVCYAFEGKCVKVIDGDTIEVLTSWNEIIKVRLYGIDAPEMIQPFGSEAKQFIEKAIGGKTVTINSKSQDRYGRIVGVVSWGGDCINATLLQEGYAWYYEKYCRANFCNDWANIELTSKSNKRGIWTSSSPVAPWEYRKNTASQKANNIHYFNAKGEEVSSEEYQNICEELQIEQEKLKKERATLKAAIQEPKKEEPANKKEITYYDCPTYHRTGYSSGYSSAPELDISREVHVEGHWRKTKSGRTWVRPHTRSAPNR